MSLPLRYSPANPDNPMVFNRVPYEKRLHWLWMWNPDNDAQHIDCGVAADTLVYFTAHQTQQQQQYYYGSYHGVNAAKRDLDKCLYIKGLASKDLEQADKALKQYTAEKEAEEEHVWRFRDIPLHIDPPT